MSENNRKRLGRIGIWSMELRFGDPGAAVEAMTELDELGYGAAWVPGGIGGDITGDIARLLGASKRATVATGIINIWKHEPKEIADWWHAQSADLQARTLFGLGVSHGPLIGETWGKPLAVMRTYLDGLAAEGVPADKLCLAALGPKMLELSRDRTAGAHPYLVTPEHTAAARAILGPDALLAPEQGVILETDPDKARAIARPVIGHYGKLPNYANNWQRYGFTAEEIEGASDRLIDALFAWGTPEKIAERVGAHHTAGADHVCVQVLTGGTSADTALARAAWRTLAEVLL